MPLQIRRGTDVQRQAMTPAAGELIFVENTNQLYVGNGFTPGGILATGYTNNDAQDAAAVIFTANNPAHSNINFAYNTSTNLITAAVDLSNYTGTIRADAFKGSIFADDSTLLVDAVAGSIPAAVVSGTFTGSVVGNLTGDVTGSVVGNLTGDVTGSVFADNSARLIDGVNGTIDLDGTISGNIIPTANEIYDIGSGALRFRDLYLSGNSIELGAATITATGSAVNLPAGSTVGGEIIGTGGGNNDYSGNIIGDDSSIIVNTANNSISVADIFINGAILTSESLSGVQSISVGTVSSPTSLIIYGIDTPSDNVAVRGSTAGNIMSLYTDQAAVGSTSIIAADTDLFELRWYARTNATVSLGAEREGYGLNAKVIVTSDANAVINSGDQYIATEFSLRVFNSDDPNDLTIVDINQGIVAITGAIETTDYIQFGSLTTGERDALSAANGMVIYNSTVNRFQGRQNSAWINLDDGTSA